MCYPLLPSPGGEKLWKWHKMRDQMWHDVTPAFNKWETVASWPSWYSESLEWKSEHFNRIHSFHYFAIIISVYDRSFWQQNTKCCYDYFGNVTLQAIIAVFIWIRPVPQKMTLPNFPTPALLRRVEFGHPLPAHSSCTWGQSQMFEANFESKSMQICQTSGFIMGHEAISDQTGKGSKYS